MLNVLVTGGAGFIGSNFVHYLLRVEPDVRIVNLDALTYAGSLENLKELPDPGRHTFVHGDICNRALVEELFNEYQIDTVVHFAAETHVDRSILYPDMFVQANIIGTFTLLEAARKIWLSGGLNRTGPDPQGRSAYPNQVRFHHVSTDEVYGTLSPDDPPWSETTPYAPSSPYSASKAASDHLVRAYGHTYGLPYTITNCSNNYGPHQFPEKLIPLMVSNAMNGLPLPIYGDGQQVRDWLFVEDHCDAIWTVLTRGKPGETYNIGAGNQPTNLLMVQTMCEILDECLPGSPYVPHDSLIQHVTDRPGHDRRYALDIMKIRNELGWSPSHSLNTGLLSTVQWYLAHSEWIEAVRKQQEYQKWLEKNYDQR
jgi:dTDP-glucose 4,6-dehydratase